MAQRLPRAVKRQAEEADRLLRELSAKPGEEIPPVPAEPNPTPAAAASTTVTDAGAPQPAVPSTPQPEPSQQGQQPAPADDDFRQRYLVLKGKYDKEIPELKIALSDALEQNRELRSMLEQQSHLTRPQPPAVTRNGNGNNHSKLIKPEEEEEYGKDFFDVVGRRAREIAEEMVEERLSKLNLQQQPTRSPQQQAEDNKERVRAALESSVPGWVEINQSQNFLAWLADVDVFSGKMKRELLTDAFKAGDAARVVSFFKAFQEDSAGTPTPTARTPSVDAGTLVAPQTSLSGNPVDAPGGTRIWTQAEIAEFYAEVRRGRIPPDRKNATEREIIRAAAEGRVQ